MIEDRPVRSHTSDGARGLPHAMGLRCRVWKRRGVCASSPRTLARVDELRSLLAAGVDPGRSLWIYFNWEVRIEVKAALRRQLEQVKKLVPVLHGPCASVGRLVLDALPEMGVEQTVAREPWRRHSR